MSCVEISAHIRLCYRILLYAFHIFLSLRSLAVLVEDDRHQSLGINVALSVLPQIVKQIVLCLFLLSGKLPVEQSVYI